MGFRLDAEEASGSVITRRYGEERGGGRNGTRATGPRNAPDRRRQFKSERRTNRALRTVTSCSSLANLPLIAHPTHE
ncbi:jg19554 [Pararge aegeria aegeria]|uniref:Jg19554 protein n=1 Tax=Pararge aegeria aegeria TaxID=348720 RepID=A0A8S4R9B6_9NEOP|nr:jg19554 [Pararge aegeria aegeria]